MIQSKTVIKNAQNLLLQTAKDLETIEIKPFQEQVFHANDFRNMAVFNEKNALKKSSFPVIYTIELIHAKDKKKIVDIFKTFFLQNKDKAKSVDRINHSKDNTIGNPSLFLYVGSSTTSFVGRLKNHLGVKDSIRTYSLHLSKWDKNIDYQIKVCTYQVISNVQDIDVKNLTVEILEQQIWDQCKPLFGKRSGLG